MKAKKNLEIKVSELREKAEERLNQAMKSIEALPDEKAIGLKSLVHELQVHQIELEMQNEELRAIQIKLEQSKNEYSNLYDFAPVGYLTIDTKGIIQGVNLTACAMLQQERKSLLHSSLFTYIDRNDRDLLFWYIAAMIESGDRQTCELRLDTEIDEEFYVLLDSAQEKINNGDPARFNIAMIDITQQKKAEIALIESEKKYRHLIENSHDAIYLLYNRKFELINKQFQNLFGLTIDDVTKPDFDFMSLVAPASRDFVKSRKAKIIRGEHVSPLYEFTALAKSGEEISVEECVSDIPYKGGTAIQGILRDVTERKRQDKELYQSQKLESIGKLTGGIAHDFNNILTVISGYSEVLMVDESLAPHHKQDLKEIKKAAGRAATLTQQLLAYGRKQPLAIKTQNLNEIVSNIIKMLQRLIGENIELEIKLAPDLKSAKVDSGQIGQILMNLAINARDAIHKNGKIFIRTENVTIDEAFCNEHSGARPGEFICLFVEDTGKGMEKELFLKIFDPYFTTKGLALHSGLGLSVVDGVVKQHEGWVIVSSTPKVGSSFKIFLPASRDEKPAQPTDLSLARKSQGNGQRILVIEDEKAVINFLEKTLKSEGYNVYKAMTAKDATEIFKREKGNFDVIFSDMLLPDSTGLEVVLKFTRQNPGLRVVLGSGYAGSESDLKKITQNGYKFLPKPYSFQDIIHAVRELLEAEK